jgi:DNA-binding transcriptional ArsR family regulator
LKVSIDSFKLPILVKRYQPSSATFPRALYRLPQKYATIALEFKDNLMKVNYQETIEEAVPELKILMQQQRTITNRQKVQALYLLKSGSSQSITEVSELLGLHRITVQRWLKQYNEGGLSSLLKLRRSTGRPRVIPSEVIAGISGKISE